jgi:hypothetical protein
MSKTIPRWKEKFTCIGKDCGKTITGPDAYRLHLMSVHKLTPAKAKAQRDKQRKRTGQKSRKVVALPVKAASVHPAA